MDPLDTPRNNSAPEVLKRASGRNGRNGKPESHSDALQGWKEIAAYLKRGVRTAQRWEQTAGLPVRRPRPGERSPVFAFPEELEAWMKSFPVRRFPLARGG